MLLFYYVQKMADSKQPKGVDVCNNTDGHIDRLEIDSTGPELWFTEIIFNQRGQVKLSWKVQPHVMIEGTTCSLECNSSKGVKKEKTGF